MGLKPAAPLPDVALLQQKLGITADGRFGTGTLAAVQAFQRKTGLEPDGVVGRQTWTALFAVRA
jgi:N-acetylmuramoyl-L-alanine amidase